MVENGSTDNSSIYCSDLEKEYSQVCYFSNKVKGTSLARKRGVQEAKGQYILFFDQDDFYINRFCVEKMVMAIREDKSQICQFGYYKHYIGGLKKKIECADRVFERSEFLEIEAMGIIGAPNNIFNVNVWTKIYDASILKEVVETIDKPLFFAEDMYLNLLTFFNKGVRKVSTRKEAYYVWNVGTGFSSSETGELTLFDEYSYIKPLTVNLLNENHCPETMIRQCYLEVIYFYKSIIQNMIFENIETKIIKSKIRLFEEYEFVQAAKNYFRNISEYDNNINEELLFLSSDYSDVNYIDYCKKICQLFLLKKE